MLMYRFPSSIVGSPPSSFTFRMVAFYARVDWDPWPIVYYGPELAGYELAPTTTPMDTRQMIHDMLCMEMNVPTNEGTQFPHEVGEDLEDILDGDGAITGEILTALDADNIDYEQP